MATAAMVLAFVGIAVVGVDVGHVAFTATSIQTGAEIAATAGATRLLAALEDGLPGGLARGAAVADAQVVLGQNTLGGTTMEAGNNCGTAAPPMGKYRMCLEAGRYVGSTNTFVPSVEPYNSVRATLRATVPNIVAGIWPGNEKSTIVKTAVAGLQSIAAGGPELPFMIGDCYAPEIADCNDEAVVTIQVPDPQRNTGWTNWNPDVDDLKIVDFSDAFGADVATNEILADTTGDGLIDVVSYWMPMEWCADHDPMGGKDVCGGGGGGGPGEVKVGDQYQMLDKEAKQSSWMLGDGIVNHDTDTFRVVLMECTDDSTKRAGTVTGFATIKIDRTHIESDSWDQKEWKFSFVCDAEVPGPPGGVEAGTGFVALLQ